MNSDELTGNVALVHRSATPLVQKILHAQEAGAVGVVLVDDGRCESDLNCGRIGSARLGGFAPRDDPSSWRLVKIPSVLVSQETGKRIRRLMRPRSGLGCRRSGRSGCSPRSVASHKRRRGARCAAVFTGRRPAPPPSATAFGWQGRLGPEAARRRWTII